MEPAIPDMHIQVVRNEATARLPIAVVLIPPDDQRAVSLFDVFENSSCSFSIIDIPYYSVTREAKRGHSCG